MVPTLVEAIQQAYGSTKTAARLGPLVRGPGVRSFDVHVRNGHYRVTVASPDCFSPE